MDQKLEELSRQTEQPLSNLPVKPHHFLTKKVAVLGIAFLLTAVFSSLATAYVLSMEREHKLPEQQNHKIAQAATPSPAKSFPTPTQSQISLTPTPDPHPDWKTYINPKHRVTFRYPATYLISDENEDTIIFATSEKEQQQFKLCLQSVSGECYMYSLAFSFKSYPLTPGKTLEDYTHEGAHAGSAVTFSKTTVNGNEALVSNLIDGIGKVQYYLIKRDDDVLFIDLGSVTDAENNMKTALQILKTMTYPQRSTTSCTLEAKICPDGSTVGRTGPNCEFAACPTSR